jgi:hypothetical protein
VLSPLCNLYSEEEVWLWLQLLPGWKDFDLSECENDEIGDKPEWLKNEISESGIEGIVQCEYWKADGGSWVYWGLTNGIGPGQPFCVRVLPPIWSKSGGWDGPVEWDVEWTWDLLRVMPRKLENAAKSWQRHFDAERRWKAKQARMKKALEARRAKDTAAMYLRWDIYYGNGYDEMAGPHGIRVHLCSKHERLSWVQLGGQMGPWGEDNGGSREVALQKLIAEAAVKYPHLDEASIRKLPTRWW